jgi:hypothetical protein
MTRVYITITTTLMMGASASVWVFHATQDLEKAAWAWGGMTIYWLMGITEDIWR